jgi:hypothetical protein
MMAIQADVADVLRRWRTAENELLGVPTGSPEFRALRAEVISLREEFRRLSAEALIVHQAPPPQMRPTEEPA